VGVLRDIVRQAATAEEQVGLYANDQPPGEFRIRGDILDRRQR